MSDDSKKVLSEESPAEMLKSVNAIQRRLLRMLTVDGCCRERYRLICDLIDSVAADCRDNPGERSDATLRDYDDLFRSFMYR